MPVKLRSALLLHIAARRKGPHQLTTAIPCEGTRSYPCNVDTALGDFLVFKLLRTESVTGTVPTPSVVISLNIVNTIVRIITRLAK